MALTLFMAMGIERDNLNWKITYTLSMHDQSAFAKVNL
jgi:hypothetical protein